LEKSIANMAKSFLFEFNDAFTRSRFSATVEPFMRDIQGRGGVQDFAVVCDTCYPLNAIFFGYYN